MSADDMALFSIVDLGKRRCVATACTLGVDVDDSCVVISGLQMTFSCDIAGGWCWHCGAGCEEHACRK